MSRVELNLAPEQAGRLFRHRAVSARRMGRGSVKPVSVVWHRGTAEGTVLAAEGGRWRLERTVRLHGLPAGCAVAAEGDQAAVIGETAPVPLVSFSGRRRVVGLRADPEAGLGAVQVTLLDGMLRDVSREWPCCRVTLEGDGAVALASVLGETLGLSMPVGSLAEEALSASRGDACEAPEAAVVEPDASVDAAIRTVVGHLAVAMAYWAPLAARGGLPVAVHQMRVAIRRLRSAMVVFKAPLDGSLDGMRAPLLTLAARLGAARDWDVFLAGTGAELGRAMAGDKRIFALLEDATRSRDAAYAELRRHLASAGTRRLLLDLALLPSLAPWVVEGDEARAGMLAAPVREFAPRILDRRFKRLVGAADELSTLPADALHDTRKSGKKLRYALEFFSPVLPRRAVRKFARRLSRAQDELGAINDTETGAALLQRLTHGGRHEFASGAVLGWLSAKAEAARAPLAETWDGLRRQERFWRA